MTPQRNLLLKQGITHDYYRLEHVGVPCSYCRASAAAFPTVTVTGFQDERPRLIFSIK